MKFIEKRIEEFYLYKEALINLISEYVGSLYIRIYLIILFLLNGCLWILAGFISASTKGDLIALHYQVDYGVNLIGNAGDIYLLPAIGLIIILINIFLSLLLVKRNERDFITHVLFAAAALSHLFIAIALWLLYIINYQA